MTICAICIILIITEIILFARMHLKPLTYLVLQVVKATLWIILFLMTLVGVNRGSGSSAASEPVSFGSFSYYLLAGLIESIIVLYVISLLPTLEMVVDVEE